MDMDNSKKITWLSLRDETPARGYWDQTLLEDLLKDYIGSRQVVIIPGAYQGEIVDQLNETMAQYPKVLVIVTSDEENKFPIDRLAHKDMKIFMTYPIEKYRDIVDEYLPIGYCPDTRKYVKENGMSAKNLDWFFAGQDTHKNRHDCIEALKDLQNGKLVATEGFAQGLNYKEYMNFMCRAKVIPCPEGNISPDSFRLYEALEAGCIPVVRGKQFWKMLFGEVPFPVIDEWSELPGVINHYKDRPDIANKCYAWWQFKKRDLKWTVSQS